MAAPNLISATTDRLPTTCTFPQITSCHSFTPSHQPLFTPDNMAKLAMLNIKVNLLKT